jgi:hypothetical protein
VGVLYGGMCESKHFETPNFELMPLIMGWPDFNEILGVFRESQSAFGKNMGILKS